MNTRTIALTVLASTLLIAGAVAVFPSQAEEEDGLTVSIEITQTVPTLQGLVTVRDASGAPVAAADVTVTTTHGLLPNGASTSGPTNLDGEFFFGFSPISGASLPGDHHLVADASTAAGASGSAATGYSVP